MQSWHHEGTAWFLELMSESQAITIGRQFTNFLQFLGAQPLLFRHDDFFQLIGCRSFTLCE